MIQKGAKVKESPTGRLHQSQPEVQTTLKHKMSQIIPIQGASMVPEVVPPPEKTEEVIPQLVDLVTDREVRQVLVGLIESNLQWAKQESEAKKARKPIVTRIKSILGKFQVGKAAWEGYIVNYFAGKPRESIISKDKLVLYLTTLGWQPKDVQLLLANTTSTGKPTYTLKITASGEEEDNGDE